MKIEFDAFQARKPGRREIREHWTCVGVGWCHFSGATRQLKRAGCLISAVTGLPILPLAHPFLVWIIPPSFGPLRNAVGQIGHRRTKL